MVKPTVHPYTYTLELLKLAVFRLPPTFSKEKRRAYEKKLQQFLDKPSTKYTDIQKTIVSLGKDSWAYRKAYEDMYARYGHSSEEAFLLENLDGEIKEKYGRFIHEGGKIGYIPRVKSEEEQRQRSPFERYFTAKEIFAVEQALYVARDYARAEIEGLVTVQKRDEYRQLVRQYAERQQKMAAKIDELRRLAGVSKKWEPAIKDRIRTIEEGWSVVGLGTDLPELEKETEFWKGTLESFLKA